MTQASRIFNRYKVLGYVSNDIPAVTRYIKRRKENLIVTSVGKSFHTYGCNHFALLSVSSDHPEDISCLAADAYMIYTGSGNDIYAWRRGTEIKHVYKFHRHRIRHLLPFGGHLVSIDESSCLVVWNIKTEERILELEYSNKTFEITAIVHPPTYVNKVLLGSEQGTLQLVNIKNQATIYTFKGWNSGISVLTASPALHIVGIGLKDGHIVLHNLKFDETVMKFHQEWGMVSSLTFRTDGHPIMASGSVTGKIILWNLDERKVFSQINGHDSFVSGLQCLPNEPLMVSSSPDNSLKLWIFDMLDGGARLLRLREGHSAPPNFIRFHGAHGQNILSAGGDSSLRIFHVANETFNKSLGRASYNRKVSKRKGREEDPLIMPPICQFTAETTREKEWDNIAAIHSGIPVVTTWSYDKIRMGQIKLQSPCNTKTMPTCLFLTHCGNFVLIGYSVGHVERYNIQSGIHRGRYGEIQPAIQHNPVRGVCSDVLNRIVVSGLSSGSLSWYNFKTSEKLGSLKIDESISQFESHLEASLIAISLEDFTVAVVDMEERSVARRLQNGHKARITDLAWSPDARWLLSSGMDRLICTWDVPGGSLVDRFKVESACTSLSFSPTGELLATTHVDYLGIYLWFNRTLYTHVSLRPIRLEEDSPLVPLPSTSQNVHGEQVDDEDEEPKEEDHLEQIGSLLTLSNLPSSRWANLLHIDLIRKRNKPIEPPKTQKAAPFFLPTIPSLDIRFDFSDVAAEKAETGDKERILKPLTVFVKLLKSGDLKGSIEKLKNSGPTAIDFEVNSLIGESTEVLLKFLEMIAAMLDSGRDFELAQAYLGLFLKVHGEEVASNAKLLDFLADIHNKHNQSWTRLQNIIFYNMSILKSLKL